MSKEYAFASLQEQNLAAPLYSIVFSNGPPPVTRPHVTPRYPKTDLQGYLDEGWAIVQTHISVPICGGVATYRFILEREISP